MDIIVDVEYQKMRISTDLKTIAPNSQNFVKMQFRLSPEWNGLTVFAQFIQGKTAYNVYLSSDNTVFIPSELHEGVCLLMLYGTGDGNVIGTTQSVLLMIDRNSFIADASSTIITPTLYEQLVSKVDDLSEQFEDLTLSENIVTAINNAINTKLDEYMDEGKVVAPTFISQLVNDSGYVNGEENEKDWDEGDSSSPNYIKNRSHYREDIVTVICPEEEIHGFEYTESVDAYVLTTDSPDDALAGLKDGIREHRVGYVDVTVNGTAFKNLSVTNTSYGGIYIISSTSQTPFVYISQDNYSTIIQVKGFGDYDHYTISVGFSKSEYHKLSNMYLDLADAITAGGARPVPSSVIYTALETKADKNYVDESDSAISGIISEKLGALSIKTIRTTAPEDPVLGDEYYDLSVTPPVIRRCLGELIPGQPPAWEAIDPDSNTLYFLRGGQN